MPHLAVIESVRCLDCGEVYARQTAERRVASETGCPRCGYLGWIPFHLPPPAGVPRRPPWPPRLVSPRRGG